MSRTTSREDVQRSMATLEAIWQPKAEPLPDMTLAQLQVQVDSLRQSLARLEAIKPCCHSCKHFDMDHCRHFNAAIPSDFQRAAGECAIWAYDGIPF